MDAKDTTPSTGAEAPVSWNVRYTDAAGFACQLTIRGGSGAEVLGKASAAIAYLVERGAAPDGYRPSVATTTPAATPDPSDPSWCAIHNTQMKRHEKDGNVWHSHRAPDGSWCRGGKGA